MLSCTRHLYAIMAVIKFFLYCNCHIGAENKYRYKKVLQNDHGCTYTRHTYIVVIAVKPQEKRIGFFLRQQDKVVLLCLILASKSYRVYAVT